MMKQIESVVLFILIVLVFFGCKSNDKNIEASLNWLRDTHNPILVGNGTTITDISDPSVLFIGNKYMLLAGCVGEPDNSKA